MTSQVSNPCKGQRVTVRRYIQPATGKRILSSARTGDITNVQPCRDGLRIWLDGDPEWIFTGYQFLGSGNGEHGPASLVTEITLTPSVTEFKVPEYVVVDGHDGYVIWRDADGEFFTQESADVFTATRNSEMKPDQQLWVVRQLTEIPREDTSYRPFSDYAKDRS